MKALIVGLGGIGRRHARSLRMIDPMVTLVGCRLSSRTASDLGEDGDLFERIEYDLDAALACKPDVGVVSTPASVHTAVALQLARAGVHLLVEKPLAAALDDVETLLKECQDRSLVLMVGYNLRFDPALRVLRRAVLDGRIGPIRAVRAEVGQFLPDWRPGRDYRATCSAHASLGGGVLFELSHEFDYLRWIAGDVHAVSAHVRTPADLEIDVPAIADLVLTFDHDVQASVHLDMVDRAPIRRCRVLGRDGTLVWDAIAGEVRCFLAATNEWTVLAQAPEDEGRPRVTTHLREMTHFLECVTDGRAPLIDGGDGLKTLRVVLAARESAESGQVVPL